MKALILLAMLATTPAMASYYQASCQCFDGKKNIGPTFGMDYSYEAALKGAVAQCEDAGGTVGMCSVTESGGGGGQ